MFAKKQGVGVQLLLLAFIQGCIAGGSDVEQRSEGLSAREREGHHLFEEETFGGNGRTCLTCHSRETGTTSPADAQARFAANPSDPLFVGDGSDDGLGNGSTRMRAHATVTMHIPLAANVFLADPVTHERLTDPASRFMTVSRGIPGTLNTPALDPVLMYDGRAPSLEVQALGAIHDHAQATIEPTETQLEEIAEFQQTPSFFSNGHLLQFAQGGQAPTLPLGSTDSEKRGREFFTDGPVPTTGRGVHVCASCHSGPMLNQTNQFLPLPVAPGSRFQNILVSEINEAGNPVQEFIIDSPAFGEIHWFSTDIGRTAITGDPGLFLPPGAGPPPGFPFDNLAAFKIPTLWNVGNTAPYFHDNSADTLEAMIQHYVVFFSIVTDTPVDGDPPLVFTDQDRTDIVNYLKLL
jgi:cytochrome c peroxidase